MNISYVKADNLVESLNSQTSNSLEFVFLVTGALAKVDKHTLLSCLKECIRVLKKGGLLFVQGVPSTLPSLGVFLEKQMTFKYWFAVESEVQETTALPSVHAGILLFVKGNGRFPIKRTRLPHQYCQACERTLKDWGGKAHLMNPNGYVISDVIKDLPVANNYTQVSRPLFDLMLSMLDVQPPANQNAQLVDAPLSASAGLVGPLEGLSWKYQASAEPYIQYHLPFVEFPKTNHGGQTAVISDKLYDNIHQGDAIEILKQYPDNSVDLVFADPPYNLAKNYNIYADGRPEEQYIAWCNGWLTEYIRILKPTGSLFVLNLPRWAIHHAHFLNQHLYFQNWIAWDALSEPRGKIMPAHYALLFYTKQRTNFTFNYDVISPIDARHYCLRASCIRQRKKASDDEKVPLNDIWWDIHRIKHRRDRDYHPCQLPEALMERIISLATNPGDIVLDAFGGVGTTPVTALKLGRRYVAIDIDPYYVQVMRDKLAEVEQYGEVQRESVKQAPRTITKKELQLELRLLASQLGRLPTPEDVKINSQYDLKTYFETFPTWGKALKAAKLELES